MYTKFLTLIKNNIILAVITILLVLIVNKNSYSSENTKDEAYYYDTLAENWIYIFPDGNRNAAGPKFFKYLIDQDLSFEDFVEFNKRYCPVSGSLIAPGSEPAFISMNEVDSDNKVCGDMYRCCWPCVCDSMKYAKAMEISHKFQGIEKKFTVMTIDNPCGKEEFPLEVNRDYFCIGEKMNLDQVFAVDQKMIIGLLHKPTSCNSSDLLAINNHPVVGQQCKIRNSTKEEELISGMGDIFIKLSK